MSDRRRVSPQHLSETYEFIPGYKDGTIQRTGGDGHRKSQMYQEPLLFNSDPISDLSPLTYNDVSRELFLTPSSSTLDRTAHAGGD